MSSKIITKMLYVTNMTCINCENIIDRTLSETSGIVSAKASYSKGTVVIAYDENIISLQQIIDVLGKEDYQVKLEIITETGNSSENGQDLNSGSNGNQKKISNENSSKTLNDTKKIDYTNVLGIIIIVFALYLIANHLGLLKIFNSFPVAKDGMGYGMLFLIGVLTSVHCVAMCGGICLSQCVPKKEGVFTNKFSAMRPSLLYNAGRVISYTVIGGIVGAIGSVVSFSGALSGIVQVIAGIFMVIMGLNMLNVFPWLRRFNPRMPKIFAKKIYSQRNSNSPLYIGLLNGFMPCGPLQAMQLYALSTGSPLKGALSMFLFSVGTVPLMFAFGALSSFFSKKFTTKMMTASAVLVVFLGIFMFNNGIGLSGITLPSLPVLTASSKQAANVATIEDGVQVITSGITSGSYEPIVVQKGIPVKWTIQAETGEINGCNNSIVVKKYNLQMDLQVGDNVIEFTPTESGTVPFSCWMGMIRSKITVVDDLNNVDSSVVASGNNTGSESSSNGANTDDNTSSSGLDDYNNLLEPQIPTDNVVVAEVFEDGTQSVEITYDENGFSPAVIIVQNGLKTVWNIKGSNVDSNQSTLLFPYYNALLDVLEGDNPVNFIPDLDFDFFSSDGSYYGYVKVVDDINNVDIEAIKEEISQYTPSDPSGFSGGASCH